MWHRKEIQESLLEDLVTDLFLNLCKKYNVEMSETAKSPMIKSGNEVHPIGENDIRRIFEIYTIQK